MSAVPPAPDTPDPSESPDPVPEGDEIEQRRPVAPEPARGPESPDPEAPEPDALDQATEVEPGERPVVDRLSRQADEANEADVWEQSLEVPFDDEDRR